MDIILFITIIIVASVLQTGTGFGFSIVATPFLLLLFDARDAIQINLFLSLVISLAMYRKVRTDIDRGVIKRFIGGSIIGLPIGIFIFLLADIPKLKLGIGIVILALTVLLLLKFRLKQTTNRDFAIGGLSGSLTTSIGMPGPPLLLYFSGTGTSKEKLRGTTLVYYLFIYFISLLIQVIFAGTSKTVWISSLLALPLVWIGLYAGQYLFHKVNQTGFRLFMYVILLFTGLYLLLGN
ncbi:sulfite exporter TauE/SafE family protein [Sporosarcina highlanderae]|uniref:Probable membrane transporter protein n=1 Tax=Sporosarcina highlanderae TaxID=3035916 RepID=A0ABT8JPI6_9BACL|nr:sulfite exporter TauE/SafE family protein [Sporosarcina highlanderae]MDN4606718.1 sulfite exporter TauE/SafE family protein [Sporosarcina highlanderae]